MKVPEPRKLKSGSWFIQLRLGGQSIPVTASSAKECRRQAALIKAEHAAGRRRVLRSELTLGELIDAYCNKYEHVLSPSTIRGYDTIRRTRFASAMEQRPQAVKDWQALINDELKIASPKTVKNAWGCVGVALRDAQIAVPDVKLPAVPRKDLAFLEPEEILPFLEAAKGDICEIEMLLELHGLRESEVLYVLDHNMIDTKRGVINVRGAIVRARNQAFSEKQTTKTDAGGRTVPIMIPRLAALVQQYAARGEDLPTHAATTILRHVHATCERAGVTDCDNHDLRRTMASLCYSLRVPEMAVMELGGWSDRATLQKVYTKLAQRDRSAAVDAISGFYAEKSAEDRLAEAQKKLEQIAADYADLPQLQDVLEAVRKMQNAN